MKRLVKSIMMILIGLGFLVLGLYFIREEYYQYGIITLVFDTVYLVFSIIYMFCHSNPLTAYEAEVRGMLKTYDSILVRNRDVPNLEDRNIIMVYDMEDLINAQIELRKPICYIKQTESCSFILLDEKEAWIYISKLNDKVKSPVEIELKNMKRTLQKSSELSAELLEEIERTTIIKLPNSKLYRVSPIVKKENQTDENKKPSKEKKEVSVERENNDNVIEEKLTTPREKITNTYKEKLGKIFVDYRVNLKDSPIEVNLKKKEIKKARSIEELSKLAVKNDREIYCKEYDESCLFYFILGERAHVYIVREHRGAACPIDELIKEQKKAAEEVEVL